MKRVLGLLRKSYGARPWRCWGRGVDLLVETILSQNTSAANSEAGYKRLRRRFRSLSQVMKAPVEEVERCIRVSGLSRIKAPRIQSILQQIKRERGRLDLEFLREMRVEAACEYLQRFVGVGPKTARCILLFSFGMPVFPVDTHIHRIGMRLGIISKDTSVAEAHELLTEMIAPGDRYEMHVLLIEHGRRTCRARGAECERCALAEVCARGRSKRFERGGAEPPRRKPC